MKKVELFKHNKTTYENITRVFETSNKCATVQPTGSGKSFLIFKLAQDNAEIKDNGRNVVLCHYPIAHWCNADYGTIHLYGHIHAGRDSRPFGEYRKLMEKRGMFYECYNVGCVLPHIDYTPRTLDEIINFEKGER